MRGGRVLGDDMHHRHLAEADRHIARSQVLIAKQQRLASAGAPRLCRGGSSSLTNPAVHQRFSNPRAAKHTEGTPPMDEYQALSHPTWECKYHVVFIPKCRRKTLYLELHRHLGEVFRKLAEQTERDPSRPCLRGKEAQLRRAALLGQRVLRQHGGAGRCGDTGLYPQPREGRSATRSTPTLAMIRP